MDKIRSVFSSEEADDEQGIVGDVQSTFQLSWSTRIQTFVVLFVVGWAFSILGSFCLFFPSAKGLKLFACFYTIGNILSLSSTCFLMGPINQCKRMCAETRLFATILMFTFMALTIVSALVWGSVLLTLIFCLLQFMALLWYSISYIPYARNAVKGCFNSCIS